MAKPTSSSLRNTYRESTDMPHRAHVSIQVVFVVTGNNSATRRLSNIQQDCSQGKLSPPILIHASGGAGRAIASALTSTSEAMYFAVIFDDIDMPTGWPELVKSHLAQRDVGVLGFASLRPLSNGMLHDFGYELVRLPYGCATRALGVGKNPNQLDDAIDCDVVGGCAIVVNRQLCGQLDDVRRTNRWPELVLSLEARRRGLPVVALGKATFHEGSASKSGSVEQSSPSWLIERVAWEREVAHLLSCEHLPLTPIEISARLRGELTSARNCALIGAGVAAWSISDWARQEGTQVGVFSGLEEEVGLRFGGVAVESMKDFRREAFEVVIDTTPSETYDFPASWKLRRASVKPSADELLIDFA